MERRRWAQERNKGWSRHWWGGVGDGTVRFARSTRDSSVSLSKWKYCWRQKIWKMGTESYSAVGLG